MENVTINSENGKQLQNRFSKLFFKDMNTQQYNDTIAHFAKQTGLSLEQAEFELETLNPFVIVSTDYIDNSGDEESSLISMF